MHDDAVPRDDKDWTWVLQRICPECGFDASSTDVKDIPALVRENAVSWQEVLARPDVRHRPQPGVWSPFSVRSFGRYLVHDPVHHLADVT